MQIHNISKTVSCEDWVSPGRMGRSHAGMTMVELLVVIAIAAILLALAAPSFTSLANKTRLNAASSLMVSDLNLARSESVKRNARTLVCPSNAAATSCQLVNPSWTNGWLVCVDADSDGICDAATAPLMIRPALATSVTIGAVDTAPTPAAVTLVRFNANGRQGAGGLSVNMTVGGTWSGAVAKTILVSNTGNISVY